MSYEHKVQEFYDNALACYEAIMGEYWHHADPEAVAAGLPRDRACRVLHERIVALAGFDKGQRILDFGSGIGGPTMHMAAVTGASFLGVCNNHRLTQRATRAAQDRGLAERVSFRTLEDEEYKSLPFQDASFDGVTFLESVCHVPDKAALMRELSRVLKPGCRLGGMDWIRRPFGELQTDDQVLPFIRPIQETIAIPWLGTVEEYAQMMTDAGLEVAVARDLVPGRQCWGAVQDEESPKWLGYDGPEATMFKRGEEALAEARRAGVFSIGTWIARKPR